MKNCFLMLSRLKIHVLFYFWIGLDVVRSTGVLSSVYNYSMNIISEFCDVE